MQLEILYESDHIVAINKPHGLLVHKTKIAKDATEFALQMLRDQINTKVYPAHRLDRKTSGVLVFSKNKATDIYMQKLFMERKVKKSYLAIVRGFLDNEGTIDYAIGELEVKKDAITHYKLLKQFEVNWPLGKHSTSRYSLIRVTPETGRFHQIRKHMSHIFHPIIGDRPHGCSKQNRMWKANFQMESMMLHAETVKFVNLADETISIHADQSLEFKRVLDILESQNILKPHNAG